MATQLTFKQRLFLQLLNSLSPAEQAACRRRMAAYIAIRQGRASPKQLRLIERTRRELAAAKQATPQTDLRKDEFARLMGEGAPAAIDRLADEVRARMNGQQVTP